jgi:hypothetical protein
MTVLQTAERFFQRRKAGIVLKNSGNHGKGFSVKRGVLHAQGKYILFSDADLPTLLRGRQAPAAN